MWHKKFQSVSLLLQLSAASFEQHQRRRKLLPLVFCLHGRDETISRIRRDERRGVNVNELCYCGNDVLNIELVIGTVTQGERERRITAQQEKGLKKIN